MIDLRSYLFGLTTAKWSEKVNKIDMEDLIESIHSDFCMLCENNALPLPTEEETGNMLNYVSTAGKMPSR